MLFSNRLEHIMRTGNIIIGIIVASYAMSIRAEEYKKLTNAAYCVGVYQGNIEMAAANKISLDSVRNLDATAEQRRKQTFVDDAIK
jgi:hypothetical protein